MPSDLLQSDDFIAYPTNRVVATLADAGHTQAAVDDLLKAGFAREDIDVLNCEADIHRPPPAGSENRFAQVHRTLTRTVSDEYKHLRHYVEDLRSGRCVVMVLAKKPDRRETAANILSTHGADAIEFFGRWSWQELEGHPALPDDGSRPDPTPGRTYEIDLDGAATRVRLDSESRATILRKSPGSREVSRLLVTYLKPQLLMITWQEASDRTTNVHVYDFESGQAHAVVSYGDRRLYRAKGTVRRAN
jgi:hypothetical protein